MTQIREEGLHAIHSPPPKGFVRGIDVLGDDLTNAIIMSARSYQQNHKRPPNLIDPTNFTEKQLLFKFFAPIPEESPSDKLRSAGYAPQSVRHLFSVPKKIWVSGNPTLPENDEIESGSYYFKSNHGAGTNMPIEFPLTTTRRKELEMLAQNWLTRVHNQRLSLWWYETIERNIFLEEDLRFEDGDAPDWKFFVINGRVEIFQVDTGRYSTHVQTIYNRGGRYTDEEMYFAGGDPVPMPDELPEMIWIAEAIGTNFDFIRVDMFRHRGKIFLGEIGLVPSGATSKIRSESLDVRLGSVWETSWIGRDAGKWDNAHYRNVKFVPHEACSQSRSG